MSTSFDAPLTDALLLMHTECLTSVPVVDHSRTVVGNISTADVKHLVSANNAWLLKNSCMTFISKILTERGVEHGRDSVPVFHVTPYSTLGHTVAKLVATRSHRMWVIESASPSPSMPTTPLLGPTHPISSSSVLSSSPAGTVVIPPPTPSPLSSPISAPQSAPVSSSPLPTQTTFSPAVVAGSRSMSGRLTGVVSLTDVLNLFAKSSGLRPADPAEQRFRRRRSSSASVRPSLDLRR